MKIMINKKYNISFCTETIILQLKSCYNEINHWYASSALQNFAFEALEKWTKETHHHTKMIFELKFILPGSPIMNNMVFIMKTINAIQNW